MTVREDMVLLRARKVFFEVLKVEPQPIGKIEK